MMALDGIWNAVGAHDTFLGVAGMIVVVVHLGLLILSIAVLVLALWSIGRPDRQWKLSSYLTLMLAVGYLVVTWYAFR